MLSRKLYFIHNFDEKMHYSIFHSLLKVKDNDGIDINDSVQSKNCDRELGRWNFVIDDKDYSCGVYNALETIRQSAVSALKNNKSCVDIALVSQKNDPDICYVLNEEEFENYMHMDRLKKANDRMISKRIFFKVIKPVLKEMFKKINYQILTKVFKDKSESEPAKKSLIDFRRDLNVVHCGA